AVDVGVDVDEHLESGTAVERPHGDHEVLQGSSGDRVHGRTHVAEPERVAERFDVDRRADDAAGPGGQSQVALDVRGAVWIVVAAQWYSAAYLGDEIDEGGRCGGVQAQRNDVDGSDRHPQCGGAQAVHDGETEREVLAAGRSAQVRGDEGGDR